jgi:hypothetical protein
VDESIAQANLERLQLCGLEVAADAASAQVPAPFVPDGEREETQWDRFRPGVSRRAAMALRAAG